MTRPRSICYTRLGETPTYRANPRTDIFFCSRACRNLGPMPLAALARLAADLLLSRSGLRPFVGIRPRIIQNVRQDAVMCIDTVHLRVS